MLGSRSMLRLALLLGSFAAMGAVGCVVEVDDDGPGGSATCEPGGHGSLSVDVSGLPGETNAKVSIDAPDGNRSVSASDTRSDAASGEYQVTADRVALHDTIVGTVFGATVSDPTFCLADGGTQSVEIGYSAIPSSHKLWVTNSDGGAGPLLAFDGDLLTESASPAPTVSITAGSGHDITFDREGNLWTVAGTVADAPLQRFAAASLGTSGAHDPDLSFSIPSLSCIPGASQIAFDSHGNLWLASACAGSVVEFSAAQIAASGDLEPTVSLTGVAAPRSIAFDAAGNLWVADSDATTIGRFDASRLGASSSGPPDLVLTAQMDESAPDGYAPSFILFDSAGNLWGNDFGANVVYPIHAADLAGTGAKAVIPSVHVTIGVAGLLEGMAFDDEGGLWMALAQGTFGRLGPEQLGTSSGPGDPTVPATIVSSSGVGYASNVAFFPAAPGLPLYHSFE